MLLHFRCTGTTAREVVGETNYNSSRKSAFGADWKFLGTISFPHPGVKHLFGYTIPAHNSIRSPGPGYVLHFCCVQSAATDTICVPPLGIACAPDKGTSCVHANAGSMQTLQRTILQKQLPLWRHLPPFAPHTKRKRFFLQTKWKQTMFPHW